MRGGGGYSALSKISKKQRIACFIAGIALFTGLSLVFVTCRADAPNYEEENTDFKPIDTKPSDYTITFKNGWEDVFYPGGAPAMEDDPYTNYRFHLGVTPATIKAVYDAAEKLEYDEAVRNYKLLLAAWADYTARRDSGDPDAVIPEEYPVEPVAPTATLPYFPGSSAIDEDGVEHKYVGRQPEWDYHTFIGWEIYPAYPDSYGAYELTLNDAITANVTAVAKWADAPARPFKEITFQKADSSGVFEKRLAIPTRLAYEPDNLAGTDSVPWDDDDDPNTPDIYITYDEDNAKKDGENPIILKYEDFQIKATDVLGGTITQNYPLEPVFERDHYIVNPVTPWKDSKGAVVIDPLGTNFADNAIIYQQWSPRQYTITFDTNGIGDAAILPSPLTGLDAPTVARSGLAGVGQQLPPIAGTVTVDSTNYTFSHWIVAPEGGNRFYNTTEITGDTTLYAKWSVADGIQYAFGHNTGAVQTFTVPATGTYKIEAWGAQGGGGYTGYNHTFLDTGGSGGYSAGTITLNAGGTLYVYVGAKGGAGGDQGNGTGGSGGYNGGGKGGNGAVYNGVKWFGGGGGGGASDVRVVGGAWDNDSGLKSRIIVAGGGGGYGATSNAGGVGGGINGGDGTGYQQMAGATQNDGGYFGRGTDGGDGYNNADASVEGRGAGGGGYYGGRGALAIVETFKKASGSGGSGYVKGLLETPGHSAMMSTAPEFTALTFTGGVTTAGLNTGNGKVVITLISD